ncbi:MAG: ATP-binding cassette domain-containing protein [Oscillospiraceae bacterium]
MVRTSEGSVALEHVAFSYVPERKLIEDLNLCVQPGQRVAIVGPTGCGKTTLINLLMRFYDVTGGEIIVDGQAHVRNDPRVAAPKLRHGACRTPGSRAAPSATTSSWASRTRPTRRWSPLRRQPMRTASFPRCRRAMTPISARTAAPSAGQKQLLCITRIMLCLPPMLILDEATSSIDTRTEMKIQQAFATLMRGRTSFIVAHRLSTIREADVILVMRDGNIIEQGTHDELLEKTASMRSSTTVSSPVILPLRLTEGLSGGQCPPLHRLFWRDEKSEGDNPSVTASPRHLPYTGGFPLRRG